MTKESENPNDEFVTGDLPSVNPPVPDDTPKAVQTPASETTLLKIQDDAPAGTHALIQKAIPAIEQFIQQRKAINASIKAEFNKLKEHKIDAAPVKFVIKQRQLELEYRNAFDLTVRLVRNALGESQLSFLDANDSGDEKPAPEKKSKVLGKATGNPAARKAVESKGKTKVKLSTYKGTARVAH